MSQMQTISPETWKRYKADIVRPYIDDGESLKSIQKILNKRGFNPSKTQLERQVRKWKLDKNITKAEWNSIFRKIERRKSQGKETNVYLNGKQIPPTKVRKELSRHVPMIAALRPKALSPVMGHIRVGTPVDIEDARSFTDHTTISTSQTVQQRLAVEMSFDDFQDRSLVTCLSQTAPAGQYLLYIIDLPYFYLSRKLESIVSSWVDKFWEGPAGQASFEIGFRHQMFAMHFLSQICPQPQMYHPRGTLSCRHSLVVGNFLESHIPSQYKGEIADTVRELLSFDQSPTRAYLQLIKIVVCLVANNFVSRKYETVADADSRDPLIGFFRWICAEHHMWLLFQLFDLDLPGFDILAERLLVFAARSGDEQLLRRMLEENINLDVPAWICGGIRMTALHEAVRCQNVGMIRLLLKKSACVDGYASLGASRDWHWDMAPLELLLHPAQNARYPTYGLGRIDPNIVLILLDAGAEVHEPDRFTGLTVLQKSIHLGLDDLASMILDRRTLTGVAISPRDNCSRARETLLQTASRTDNFTLVQRLLESDSHALELDRHFRIRRLNDRMSDVSKLFVSPEQFAVRNKNKNMLNLFLNHGGELDPTYPKFRSDWLERACHRGPRDLLTIVAFSPLQEATQEADMDFLNYLLDLGASLNNPQFPALPIAAKFGNLRLCKFLCAKGARVDRVSNGLPNVTALQAAASSGNLDVMRFLFATGAHVNEPALEFGGFTALQGAIHYQSMPAVKLLLEQGAEVNAPTRCGGQSALQRAIGIQNEELVVLLLNQGADVNYRDPGGESALLVALSSKCLGLVDILLKSGASFSVLGLHQIGLSMSSRRTLETRLSLHTLETILKAEEKSNRGTEAKALGKP